MSSCFFNSMNMKWKRNLLVALGVEAEAILMRFLIFCRAGGAEDVADVTVEDGGDVTVEDGGDVMEGHPC